MIAALFYSPWDYGGTTASAIRGLNWILAAMLVVWFLGFTLKRARVSDPSYRRRFTPWPLLAISGLLLAIGWAMALNAHSICDTDYFVFIPLRSPLGSAPGSVDYSLSCAWMLRATLLIGGIWTVAHLVQDERWLLRIWWAIGLAGGSIALLGLLQKASGAEMIFWQTPDKAPVTTFFATYYYHANAGAYLNLTLPPIAGLAYRYTTRPSNPAVRALWLTIGVIMIVAVVCDTSRMAQFVAVLIALTLIAAASKKVVRHVQGMELKTALIAMLVLSAALWAVTQASHIDEPLKRWSEFQSAWPRDARWLVAAAAFHSLPEAGSLGFGPGTFSVVFPYFAGQPGDRSGGIWLFLHNDYLQTMMEWGWIGAALWAGVLFGGMIVAVRGLRDKRRSTGWFPRQRLLLPLIVTALGGVAIHALVDFPLQISSIQLYVATYLGICWGSCLWKDPASVVLAVPPQDINPEARPPALAT